MLSLAAGILLLKNPSSIAPENRTNKRESNQPLTRSAPERRPKAMIHLGLHTDNWRPLSVGFEAACQKIARAGLQHIEFCAIHGQNFIAALGYHPGVSLQSNPIAVRRF